MRGDTEEKRKNICDCCCAEHLTVDGNQIALALEPKLEESQEPQMAIRPNSFESARSHGSAASSGRSMTSDEKRREKQRLQDMVRDFARAVSLGMPCHWLDSSGAGRACPAVYSLDESLTWFTVQPDGGQPIAFQITCIHEVSKHTSGTPFSNLHVLLTDAEVFKQGFACVQYKVGSQVQPLGILLPNSLERERFIICMKILRWAIGDRQDKPPGNVVSSPRSFAF